MLNILRKYFPLNYHPAATSLPENPCAYGLLKRLCGELENGGCAVTSLPALNRNMESEMTAGSRNEHGTGNVDTNTATASGIFIRKSKGWSSHSRHSFRTPRSLALPSSFHAFERYLDGRTYLMQQQHIGLFPLFMQVFHNNMTDGISRVSFSYQSGQFCVSFTEGDDVHKLNVGFQKAVTGTVSVHGETYLIATLGEFARDENHVPVLKLEITFPEECVKRKTHIFFHNEQEIEIRWNETPGKKMILEGLTSITEELSGNFLYNSLLGDNNITLELRHHLMEQTIEPVVWGDLEMPEAESVGTGENFDTCDISDICDICDTSTISGTFDGSE